jgi:hypothetical protein
METDPGASRDLFLWLADAPVYVEIASRSPR